MWLEIRSNDDVQEFMRMMAGFHDGCIKELKYVSGAYVSHDLSMNPVNDCRNLNVIIQRQFKDNSVIEMEFQKLKYMILRPVDEDFTCEILSATMFIKDGLIYWSDNDNVSMDEIEKYTGTVICAAQMRWRAIPQGLGNHELYATKK